MFYISRFIVKSLLELNSPVVSKIDTNTLRVSSLFIRFYDVHQQISTTLIILCSVLKFCVNTFSSQCISSQWIKTVKDYAVFMGLSLCLSQVLSISVEFDVNTGISETCLTITITCWSSRFFLKHWLSTVASIQDILQKPKPYLKPFRSISLGLGPGVRVF